MSKYIKMYLLLIFLTILLCGCSPNIEYSTKSVTSEQPHLYWKDIKCKVINCNYQYWYASGAHFQAEITVYSEEYNITRSFQLTGYEAKECEKLNEGDSVICELYTWMMDSTGEVVRRQINKIKS